MNSFRQFTDSHMTFPDHFSTVATQYAASRPHYPDELFAWLATQAPARDLVWDAGCGSGQASVALAAHFARVIATDASAKQLESAEQRANITFHVAAEVNPSLADHSVDVVTVAQALHWFNREAFYREVERVLKPGGLLAVWTYDLLSVSPAIDAVVLPLYGDTLGACWPPERHHVETQYREIGFPYALIEAPPFAMRASWTRERFVGYLETWSAVKEYRRLKAADPIALVRPALDSAWPDAGEREVRWPLTVLAGRPQR